MDPISDILTQIRNAQAVKKKIFLKWVPPDKPLPKVKADADKIRQVITNLIDNSIKYTKKGGVIVKAQKNKKNIIVTVSDTGVGIDPKDLPRLFQKFSRGKGMSLIHTEGTGLGLFVARLIVEAHHGRVWVESPGVGKGSRFYFTLPVDQSSSNSLKPKPKNKKHKNIKTKNKII